MFVERRRGVDQPIAMSDRQFDGRRCLLRWALNHAEAKRGHLDPTVECQADHFFWGASTPEKPARLLGAAPRESPRTDPGHCPEPALLQFRVLHPQVGRHLIEYILKSPPACEQDSPTQLGI